jgi:hypothetical protein
VQRHLKRHAQTRRASPRQHRQSSHQAQAGERHR